MLSAWAAFFRTSGDFSFSDIIKAAKQVSGHCKQDAPLEAIPGLMLMPFRCSGLRLPRRHPVKSAAVARMTVQLL